MDKPTGYITHTGEVVLTDIADNYNLDSALDKLYTNQDIDIDYRSDFTLIRESKIDIDKSIIDNDNEQLVTWLCDKLSDPDGRRFYEMVVSKVPLEKIESALTYALDKGKKPAALFNTLIRRNIEQG